MHLFGIFSKDLERRASIF